MEVWAGLGSSTQPADVRNFHYQSISDQLFSSQLLERTLYKGTRNSPVEGGQWTNHQPSFAIDDKVDHSKVVGNYRQSGEL